MTLHGTALWLHIVLAVLLVGGSAWTHVASVRLRRARTVDEARAHAATVHGFVRASMPLAVGTLVAGAYLATVGSYWTSPWLVTSLVLFAVVGALSGSRVDPATTQLVAALDAAPAGPLTADLVDSLHSRGLTLAAMFGGIDLAVVFLMTNKPGLLVSVLVAGVGFGVGLLLTLRERQPAAAAV